MPDWVHWLWRRYRCIKASSNQKLPAIELWTSEHHRQYAEQSGMSTENSQSNNSHALTHDLQTVTNKKKKIPPPPTGEDSTLPNSLWSGQHHVSDSYRNAGHTYLICPIKSKQITTLNSLWNININPNTGHKLSSILKIHNYRIMSRDNSTHYLPSLELLLL